MAEGYFTPAKKKEPTQGFFVKTNSISPPKLIPGSPQLPGVGAQLIPGTPEIQPPEGQGGWFSHVRTTPAAEVAKSDPDAIVSPFEAKQGQAMYAGEYYNPDDTYLDAYLAAKVNSKFDWSTLDEIVLGSNDVDPRTGKRIGGGILGMLWEDIVSKPAKETWKDPLTTLEVAGDLVPANPLQPAVRSVNLAREFHKNPGPFIERAKQSGADKSKLKMLKWVAGEVLGRVIPGVSKGHATGIEGAARGTVDMGIMGQLAGLSLEAGDVGRAQLEVDKHLNIMAKSYWGKQGGKYDKTVNWLYGKPDLVGIPEEVVQSWEDDAKPKFNRLNEAKRAKWRVLNILMTERERARTGGETQIGSWMKANGDKKGAAKFEKKVVSAFAEQASYFADPGGVAGTLGGISAKAAAQTAGKGFLRRTTQKGMEGAGGLVERAGVGLREAATSASKKAEEAVAKLVDDPDAAKLATQALPGRVGTIARVGELTGTAIETAGQVMSSTGRIIGDGPGQRGFLGRIGQDKSVRLRHLIGAGEPLDGMIDLGVNTMKAGGTGVAVGGGLGALTGEPEYAIAGAVTGGVLGAGQAVPLHMFGVNQKAKQTNDVKAWIEAKPEETRALLGKLDFEQQLSMANVESLVKGVSDQAGAGDVDVRYVHGDDAEAIRHERGAWIGDRGELVVNLNHPESAGHTLAHESMHALEDLPHEGMQERVAALNAKLFDTLDIDGNLLTKGLYSLEDEVSFVNQYQNLLNHETVPHWRIEMGLEGTGRITKEQYLKSQELRSSMHKEVRAESFASMARSSDLGTVGGVKQRFMDHIMLAENSSKLARLRDLLMGQGVKFESNGAPSALFIQKTVLKKPSKPGDKGVVQYKRITNNREVDALLRDFVRVRRKIRQELAPEPGEESGSSYTLKQLSEPGNERIAEYFKDNDTFAKDNEGNLLMAGGRPVRLSQGEINKLQKKRSNAMLAALDNVDSEGGLKRNELKSGKYEWVGHHMNDAQMAAMMALPNDVFAPSLKEKLRRINYQMQRDGATLLIDYNAALKKGKYSSAISSAWRHDSPFGMRLTAARNLTITGFNIDRVLGKMNSWRGDKKGRFLDLWGGDYNTFKQSMHQYMDNHMNNRPGHTDLDADGAIALQKKDRINELFDVPDSEAKRDLTLGVGRRPRLISSRRFDRINQIRDGDGNWHTDYGKMKENRMPAGKKPTTPKGDKGARYMPAGSDASYMKAAKKGDTDTAQRMVNQAAKVAGYEIAATHRTSTDDITQFDHSIAQDRLGRNMGLGLGRGKFYFSGRHDGWVNPDKPVNVEAHLKVLNPISQKAYEAIVAEEGGVKDMSDLPGRAQERDTAIAKADAKVKAMGHDGIVQAFRDSDGQIVEYGQIAVFDPNQIKSADPITRDKAGNIIPLSKRFQSSSDDIRYMPAGGRGKKSGSIPDKNGWLLPDGTFISAKHQIHDQAIREWVKENSDHPFALKAFMDGGRWIRQDEGNGRAAASALAAGAVRVVQQGGPELFYEGTANSAQKNRLLDTAIDSEIPLVKATGSRLRGGVETEYSPPARYMPAGKKGAGKDPYSDLIYRDEKLPKGVIRDEQANLQYKGKQPKDWTPEDFKEFGEKFGVKNLGPLSEIQTIKDKATGHTLRLPGGLEGKFTYYDLLWIKNNNPEVFPRSDAGGFISEGTHAKITDKLARTLTPPKGDKLETFNRMVFGMLSPNTPLLPNLFGHARTKFASIDDVKRMAKMAELLPENPTQKQRKAVSDKIKKALGIGAADKGGLGIGITQDFTNVAEFARLWLKDPEWFNKSPDEGWATYVDRVGTQLRGLGTKTASFGGVWQDPSRAMISAIDRHMARTFADRVLEKPEMRARFEAGIVRSFNKNLGNSKLRTEKYNSEVKTGWRVNKKEGTRKRIWEKGDEAAKAKAINKLTDELETAIRDKGLPDPTMRNAKTLDDVIAQTKDVDPVIVSEWIGQAALDAMGARTPEYLASLKNYELTYKGKDFSFTKVADLEKALMDTGDFPTKKSASDYRKNNQEIRVEKIINPKEAEANRLVKFIKDPEKFKVMSDAYREALKINEEKANEMGVAIFPAQWTLWDRVRGRIEPHEVMFPGFHKLPKMGPNQIRGVLMKQSKMGYATAPRAVEAGTTSPASMAYFMPAGKDMVAVHNLSADNLKHSMKVGGIASPSMAIVDIAKGDFGNFGEITLVASKDLVDPRKGAKVFGSDVYSPRYPDISTEIPKETRIKIKKFLEPYQKLGGGDFSDASIYRLDDSLGDRGWTRSAEDHSGLQAAYLKENGILPDLDAATSKEADSYWKGRAIRDALRETVRKPEVRDGFASWIEALPEKEGWRFEEKIFRGFTPMGNRKYQPHTLDNVVKIMKRNIRAGENFNYGVGTVRAKVTPQFRSVAQIKKSRGKLTDAKSMERVKDEASRQMNDLADAMEPHLKHKPRDNYLGLDVFTEHLQEAAERGVRSIGEYYNEGAPFGKVTEFLEKLKDLPTGYFEAVIPRAVQLDEFRAAIIPSDLDPKLKKALEERGLELREYDEKDKGSRRAMLQKQTEEADLRFMPKGADVKGKPRKGSATARKPSMRLPLGAVAKQLRLERDLKKLKRN
jgi:hypothetical protein